VLYKSQQPGRHEEKVKFSMARKARSVHLNIYKAPAHGGGSHLVMRLDTRRSFLSSNPTDSDWFDCFMKGSEARIGQITKQDMVISIGVMSEMQRVNEEQWKLAGEQGDLSRMHAVAEWAYYKSYAFCHISLRGYGEVVGVVLTDLKAQIDREGEHPHLGLPLRGRFKMYGNTQVSMLCFISATPLN
jgi:hypothetical protein